MKTTSRPPLSVSPQRPRANTTTERSTSGHPEEPVRYVRLEETPVDVGSVPHRHGDAEAHKEEVDEDDPDAGIEVDVYEGSSIKRKVGVLKKDANSIAHLLTHRYRNPFCESCVKAKMRHFRSRTGAFKREVKTFGDLVTFDFVTASGDHEVEGRYALIIRDMYTGIIMAYPTARRDTDSVVRAIKHFCDIRMMAQN